MGVANNAGAGAIPGFGFNPPGAAVPDVEVIDLAALQLRIGDGSLQRVHRADFHSLTLVIGGASVHTVDFVDYPCRSGTLLWVRPGQVQRFAEPGRMHGLHLLFTPAFPTPIRTAGVLDEAGLEPVCRQLGTGRDFDSTAAQFDQIRDEYTRPDGASSEILRLLTAALLLHIDRLPYQGAQAETRSGSEVYVRFRAELERSYTDTRQAAVYARRLGYTVKTLTRACVAAAGKSAKQVIDARVILEAQRLLAHTDEPVAVVARRLGFAEPANFGRFFLHHTGTTPGEFRSGQRVASGQPR
jgi:AraC-like DNA-binding protein